MANVHKYLLEFHEAIKLDDENEILREKRDIILQKLKNRISDDAENYETFNQGSYAMLTGIRPIDSDYDIDVGIKFKMSKEDAEPLAAKNWVFEALDGHTKDVKIKTPCITVTYQQNSEPIYHVDLAVYATENTDGRWYLAKGKPNSLTENKKWEASNPLELINTIRDHFGTQDDRTQFRRIIRYLKRWKDIKFTQGGHSKPTGIALTCAAYHWLYISKVLSDVTANKYQYDDLKCLINLVSTMINNFYPVWDKEDNKTLYRMAIKLPVDPFVDLCEKMTNKQMTVFKEKLEALLDVLKSAESEVDPVEACKMLKNQFGDELPVPPPEDTAKKKSVAITTTSSSALRK